MRWSCSGALLAVQIKGLLEAAIGHHDALSAARASFDVDVTNLEGTCASYIGNMLDSDAADFDLASVALIHADLVAACRTLVAASVPHPDVARALFVPFKR